MGTGYQLTFRCAKLRLIWPRTRVDDAQHRVQRTGRTRKAPSPGKGHPRKLSMTRSARFRPIDQGERSSGSRGLTGSGAYARIVVLAQRRNHHRDGGGDRLPSPQTPGRDHRMKLGEKHKDWRAKNPLRVWRKEQGLSMMNAASVMEVGVSTLQSWEYGSTQPQFEKLSKHLHAPVPALKRRWSAWMAKRP